MSPSDKVVRQIFEDVLLGGLGGDGVADVERIQGLFGSSVSGPLRELLSRRDGACAFELGPWCVDTAADGYPEAQQRFFERPIEVVFRGGEWLDAVFVDAVPIGRDGGGQVYLASIHPPHEVSLYDPGQGEVRFLAADLVSFTYLAFLGAEAERVIDALDLDDPEDADEGAPQVQELRANLQRIAERINLSDEIVTSDFEALVGGLTGLRPAHRPPIVRTERLHERARWLLGVLGMGYDAVSLDGVDDTFDAERHDAARWSSPGVRLYWLWHAFVLDEARRLDALLRDLEHDPARLVSDAVRIIRTLLSTDPDPDGFEDLLRSRRTLSRLWNGATAALALPEPKPLPIPHQRRASFLADEGYCRDDSVFTEEARECVAAIRHDGGLEVVSALLGSLDRPPAGGRVHAELNPVGAALLPGTMPGEGADALERALTHRSLDLSHLQTLPGVIRAVGRQGTAACISTVLDLLDEFEVVWQYGYAKAGSPAIVEAVCEALTSLSPAQDAVEPLVRLAYHAPGVAEGRGIRVRAMLALARQDWSPPPEQLQSWLVGPERFVALLLAARCGALEKPDASLAITPSSCVWVMCADTTPDRLREAASLALRTVFADADDTEFAHRMALHALCVAAPADAAEVLARFVRVARSEPVRHTALALLRTRDPAFAPTFCDRPTVDAAYEEGGVQGLIDLAGAPCPVFVHNVFAKAADVGATDVFAPHAQRLADDLAQFQHRVSRRTSSEIETRFYAEVASLQAAGANAALSTLWSSGMVGLERVEAVLADRAFVGVAPLQELVEAQRSDHRLVSAAQRRGAHSEAAAVLSRMAERCPGNAAVWRNLGHALLSAGSYEPAFDAYVRATRTEPEHAMGWYWASQASYHRERWQDVIRYARQGLQVEPDNLRCRFNLGLGLQATDQLEDALAQYTWLEGRDLGNEAWMRDDLARNRASVTEALLLARGRR